VRPDVLAVVGLGAIGGSLAWQARESGIRRVVGFSPDPAEAQTAVEAGAVTDVVGSATDAVRNAQLVVLATPPHITVDLIGRLAPILERQTILTDVASVKHAIVGRAVAAGLSSSFAGSHPLAGTHGSGFAFARPNLFGGCVVYVCATGPHGNAAADAVADFWTHTMAAKPIFIDAAAHDRQLAWTSHLPQAVAYALAQVLAALGQDSDAFGPGARDTTRLAASNPDLWVDIFGTNREALLGALDGAAGSLAELRALVAAGDESGLRGFLGRAAAFRRGLGA